jgi:D-arginine dehydrogenase
MIYDAVIIGAGMAGASLAAELDAGLSVLMIEAETQPGYHATGRSAAFWDECYGGPDIQPLTTASGPFLAQPAADFSDHSFLRPRGSLYIGKSDSEADLARFQRQFGAQGVRLNWLDHRQMARHIPGLQPEWTCGVGGPDCSDIDVGALHNAYLRRARERNVQILTGSRLDRAERKDGLWAIRAGHTEIKAKHLINAAGAWADEVARTAGVVPIGHQPCRRTIAQLRTSPGAPAALPLVIDFGGQFYFKPEANGRLWLSPHDETESPPCDAAPEELDVATAIERLGTVVDWDVDAVESKWAGLRTFAPDRLPVFGTDPVEENFFWCTGQGGFGIQTAPAIALLCVALFEGRAPDPSVAEIDPTRFAPGRFRR